MIDPNRFQALLNDGKLPALFNELGWDRAGVGPHSVTAHGAVYTLTAIAQKRGVMVYLCSADAEGRIPPRATLLMIDKEAGKLAHEHLMIFGNADLTTLTWLWVARAPGQPASVRTHTWHRGQSGEALRQKLNQIVWSLDQEEAITLTDVITGLRRAFDRDRVSKAFYEKFKAEHQAFSGFIAGIVKAADRAWYASLMLNRLMFVYFIQHKGFLDGDTNYLAVRLRQVRETAGAGQFQSFYRLFLRRLFHEGLGLPKGERTAELSRLIGAVPYLNGGLFAVHELEDAHPDIDIPDEAFDRLFRFLDAYEWHLDDRPLARGNEINPDVLGYIFEKYINQKQMGAYYTKEDITEYIGKNTLLPHLLEQARARCQVAFAGEVAVWRLLRNAPDRYLYPAMRTGVIDARGDIVPESALPDFVQTGMHDAKARMFDRRYNLGEAVFHTATGERGTLPTETWREYAERRARCLTIRERLRAGEVQAIDDFITLNLDIRQFLQDLIVECASPDLLRAVWQSIVGRVPEKSHETFRHGIAILDPTCGSGAFLFAALNLLEPLYEACLDRMEGFVEDASRLPAPGKAAGGDGPFQDFVKVLAEVNAHPSRRYYIYKSIILHNLFGVDIMAEAVEICKLRLFLKLVSQVDAERELEPLPDIDFNIRCGNTLVGYATEAQFDAIGAGHIEFGEQQDHKAEIKASLADLADLFDRFREQQTRQGGRVTAADKQSLRDKLAALSLELDRYLARDYGIDPESPADFTAWRESHQPFHWFAEFYGVMREGGFDVVIGNPPYIELAKIKDYSIPPEIYKTYGCGNLYAPMMERGLCIAHRLARFGQIVPISCVSTSRMQPLRDTWRVYHTESWLSHYSGDAHPSVLFNGVKFRLSIVLQKLKTKGSSVLFTTPFQRWYPEARQHLFQTVEYTDVPQNLIRLGLIPKGNARGISCLNKISSESKRLGNHVLKSGIHTAYAHRIVAHYVKAFDFIPFFSSERDGEKRSEDYKPFPTGSKDEMLAIAGTLNSSLFYLWFVAYSDVYHCGRELILDYPCDISKLVNSTSIKSSSKAVMEAYKETSVRRTIPYKRTGTVEYDEFYPRLIKPQIDQLDIELIEAHKMSPDDIDYAINYDIKYRMGGTEDDT